MEVCRWWIVGILLMIIVTIRTTVIHHHRHLSPSPSSIPPSSLTPSSITTTTTTTYIVDQDSAILRDGRLRSEAHRRRTSYMQNLASDGSEPGTLQAFAKVEQAVEYPLRDPSPNHHALVAIYQGIICSGLVGDMTCPRKINCKMPTISG